MQPKPIFCRTAVSAAASLFAVLLMTVALPLPTVSQAAELAQTDIPLAPPPPPLEQRPPQSDPSSAADPSPSADPADGAPRPLLPSEPAEEPAVSAPPPQTEPPQTEPPVQPAAEPAPEATSTPAALPDPDGEDGQVPLPPRRPVPPDAVAAPPSPAAPLSGDAATFTDEGSQRFGRDLDAPRAGFLRVAGDLHWERAPIPPAVKTACTTRVARLGSSVAASFKEQGLWTPPEALTLTVDCDDGEERPIGTFVCKAQDFAPVLDLSCRLQPPAR